MAKKTAYKEMSTKKKARKLFWGTLAPLLTVTIVACSCFYNISNITKNERRSIKSNKSEKSVNIRI